MNNVLILYKQLNLDFVLCGLTGFTHDYTAWPDVVTGLMLETARPSPLYIVRRNLYIEWLLTMFGYYVF